MIVFDIMPVVVPIDAVGLEFKGTEVGTILVGFVIVTLRVVVVVGGGWQCCFIMLIND